MGDLGTIGKYAGAAGIILALVVFAYRQMISTSMLAQLKPDDAYRLVRLTVFLLFALGAGAMALSQLPRPGYDSGAPINQSVRSDQLDGDVRGPRRDASAVSETGGDSTNDVYACSESGSANATQKAGGDASGDVKAIAGRGCPK